VFSVATSVELKCMYTHACRVISRPGLEQVGCYSRLLHVLLVSVLHHGGSNKLEGDTVLPSVTDYIPGINNKITTRRVGYCSL